MVRLNFTGRHTRGWSRGGRGFRPKMADVSHQLTLPS